MLNWVAAVRQKQVECKYERLNDFKSFNIELLFGVSWRKLSKIGKLRKNTQQFDDSYPHTTTTTQHSTAQYSLSPLTCHATQFSPFSTLLSNYSCQHNDEKDSIPVHCHIIACCCCFLLYTQLLSFISSSSCPGSKFEKCSYFHAMMGFLYPYIYIYIHTFQSLCTYRLMLW